MPGLNTRVGEVPGPGAYEPKESIKTKIIYSNL